MNLRTWAWRQIFRAAKTVLGHPSSDSVASFLGHAPTASGIEVTEATALTFAAVYRATSVLSNTLAWLPLLLQRRLHPRGKERLPGDSRYALLRSRPNPQMSSMTFRRDLQAMALLWGNGYAEIERGGGNQAVGLWPIHSSRVRPERDPAGELLYRVANRSRPDSMIPAADMFHIAGLGGDGVSGYSVVRLARESLGLLGASERFGAQLFGKGLKPSGMLTHPGSLSKEAGDRLRASVKAEIGGQEGAHGPLLLEEGLKYEPYSIPPDDAQFLQTRQFQTLEVARWFGVPPHMLYDLERATFSNIEHQSIEFVVHSLMPWLTAWEQEVQLKLLTREPDLFAEFLLAGLLRGDTPSRYQAYAVGRQWGWLSADDIREFENLNPLPDGKGDVYLVPLNMVPAGQAPAAASARSLSLAGLAAPHIRSLADAAGRMARREIAATARAIIKKGDDLATWSADFYAQHRTVLAQALLPAALACAESLAEASGDEWPDGALEADVESLVARCVLDFCPVQTDLAEGWEGAARDRGAALASDLVKRLTELVAAGPPESSSAAAA